MSCFGDSWGRVPGPATTPDVPLNQTQAAAQQSNCTANKSASCGWRVESMAAELLSQLIMQRASAALKHSLCTNTIFISI